MLYRSHNGRPSDLIGRKLSAHKSCVNYLAFSRNDGRWLASAGDGKVMFDSRYYCDWLTTCIAWAFRLDFRVQLWDFNQDDIQRPSQTYAGPTVSLRLLGEEPDETQWSGPDS
jgi:hypothetical protein